MCSCSPLYYLASLVSLFFKVARSADRPLSAAPRVQIHSGGSWEGSQQQGAERARQRTRLNAHGVKAEGYDVIEVGEDEGRRRRRGDGHGYEGGGGCDDGVESEASAEVEKANSKLNQFRIQAQADLQRESHLLLEATQDARKLLEDW